MSDRSPPAPTPDGPGADSPSATPARHVGTRPSRSRVGRRGFLRGAGTVVAAAPAFAFTIVPRHVLGGAGHVPPSERVNLAGIGAGGMGGGDIATFAKLGATIVALCDVDDERARGTFDAHPKAPATRISG